MIKIKISNTQIMLFVLLSIILFYAIGYPSLTGEIDIQAYSDAKTYEAFAKNTNTLSEALASTEVYRNMAGPLLIYKLLGFNYILIFVFNVICLLFSITLFFRYYSINKKVFLFFLFLNPMTMFALFSVNKEILSLLAIAIFMAFIKNKFFPYFIAALLLAYLARWQLALFMVVGLAFLYLDTFFKHRMIMFVFLLASISIAFPALSFIFIRVIEHAESDVIVGSGIFQRMNDIQNHIYGGYLLVFIPKLLQLLFGLLLSRYQLITNFSDFWNNVVQYFNSFTFLLLTVYLWRKKKMKIKYLNFYLAVIYGVIFTLTMIFSVRYYYGMYIILALLASEFSYRKNMLELKPIMAKEV